MLKVEFKATASERKPMILKYFQFLTWENVCLILALRFFGNKPQGKQAEFLAGPLPPTFLSIALFLHTFTILLNFFKD